MITSLPEGLSVICCLDLQGCTSLTSLPSGLSVNTTTGLISGTPTQTGTIRVGNAPHSIVVNGNIAYVSNEGGRIATSSDFTIYSAGTEIVADATNGSATTCSASQRARNWSAVPRKVLSRAKVGGG